jgi:shikimate dehydrogenase
MNLRGVNLTIPHKEAACKLVDSLDDQAALIGAINTVVNDAGVLKGFNTDGSGLLNALKEELSFDPRGRRILLLGAGGACRAALVALSLAGASWIGIANRTRAKAKHLIDELSVNFSGTTFADYQLDASLLDECDSPVDLLVNTSAVGLGGEGLGFSPIGVVAESGFVYDMVYSKEPTKLLLEAREAGLKAADGLSMLAAQGEGAFKLWFNCDPPTGLMRESLNTHVSSCRDEI